MKICTPLIFALLACGYFSFSQVVFDLPKEEVKNNTSSIRASFAAALGYIDPKDVNYYISQDINAKVGSGPTFSYGSSEIHLAASLNFSLVVRKKNWQFRFPLEYGIGSKQARVNNDTYTYSMHRFTTGVIANYYIPFKMEDNAFYFGAGLLFHAMSFKEYSASVFGPRIEIGYTIYRLKSDYDVFIMVDIADGPISNVNKSSINFTGPSFGFRFTID